MHTFFVSLDFSISGIRKFLKASEEQTHDNNQAYLPQRSQVLGTSLAAAHFVTFRGGRVRFQGKTEWVKLDKKTNSVDLPGMYDANYITEALDCSKMTLLYEGLENISK